MDYTEVNVLNVGAGSCTVVRHAGSGHVTMVDINDGCDQRPYETAPSERPLTDPIEWCRRAYGDSVFRFVLSHPDADHMAGLRRILAAEELSITNVWDLPHGRERVEADCRSIESWHDWMFYDAMRRDVDIKGTVWPKVLSPMRSDVRNYWDRDSINIWSPTPELVAQADRSDTYNNASYVLRFRHGRSSVLVASDVEEAAWRDMLEADVLAHVKVLVASHHGRRSGFSAEAMDVLQPDVVIVSTAKLPVEHDGITEYRKRCANVFSTRVHGDIAVCLYDDNDVLVFDGEGECLVAV